MKWKNTIANYFTLLRLVCIPILWVLALLKSNQAFAIVLLIAGLTDALDGYFARKLKQASEFGAWFDSFADNLLSACIIFWFWLLLPEFFIAHLLVIVVVFAIFLLDLGIGFIKYKKMVNYHFYSAKLSCILFYTFFLHAFFFYPNTFLFYITVIITSISMIEGIIATLIFNKIASHRKSIFIKQ